MDFKVFNELLQGNFAKMCEESTFLYEVNVDKEVLYNLYLDSFPAGENDIYRERRAYDCSCCKNFIRNVGAVVSIKNGVVTSIWDFKANLEKYQVVINAMSKYVKSLNVSEVFYSEFNSYGQIKNFEQTPNGEVKTWYHFQTNIPSKYVVGKGNVPSKMGEKRDIKNVFKRSLDEISEDSVQTVLELISQGSLYKGEEWKSILTEFLKYKKEYDKVVNKDIFAWEQSIIAGAVIGKIKNHSIGTLLTNISEGMELDLAVKKYESIVAPENYKRPKAIFTKKMLEEAEKTITELGYLDSLSRRYATINDITVNNILFANKDSVSKITGKSLFDELKKEVVVNPKQFNKVEEITIDDFIKNVLPTTNEIELYLENKHSKNLISLIAPTNKDSNVMLKWDNNFSWAYTGNITDSSMKDNVKNAGGKVDGDLRFSIQWNDITRDDCDLDAHCIERASRYEIYFSNRENYSPNRGKLDVDIRNPIKGTPAVENITYADRRTMADGDYEFYVNYWSGRTTSGFRAEIEFDGSIYQFDVRDNQSGKIKVATVTLKNGVFTLKENVKSTTSTRDVWGLSTNQFTPVSVMMLSPNYWNEQQGIGNKHYFFMLKDCINPEMPNGFYNEFLKEDLMKHKRVFEALSGKMRVEDIDNQLSGIGFSSTQRNEVIVKVTSKTQRVLKIKI